MPTLFLMRHADAAAGETWGGHDLTRPLTADGRRQADAAGRFLADEDVREIRTSPAVRCRQTAEAVAERTGAPLAEDRALLEGQPIDPPTSGATLVLVAHGDNIPALLARLGVRCHSCATGSLWRVELDGGGVASRAAYLSPDDLEVTTT